MAYLGTPPRVKVLTSADIAEGAVTLSDISFTDQPTNMDITGTYDKHTMRLADGITGVGDVTITDNLILSKISDDGNAITLTNDSSTRTITGTGSLEASTLTQTPNASLTGMPGTIGSGVTMPSGSVVQMQSAVVTGYSLITAHLPSDDTIPQSSEGGEVITQSITASNANNSFLIHANIYAGTAANDTCTIALFKDSDANALAATAVLDSGHMIRTLVHKITAGSTSEITFKIRAGCTWADTYVNGTSTARLYGGVASTTLTIWEIQG